MPKLGKSKPTAKPTPPAATSGKPSSLLDTRVVYCGLRRAQSSRDNPEQFAKLPDACVDLIYIDPARVSEVELPFNSNRNYEVFWGETKEKRSFEDRHASTRAYIDYMRPRCVQLARVLQEDNEPLKISCPLPTPELNDF